MCPEWPMTKREKLEEVVFSIFIIVPFLFLFFFWVMWDWAVYGIHPRDCLSVSPECQSETEDEYASSGWWG